MYVFRKTANFRGAFVYRNGEDRYLLCILATSETVTESEYGLPVDRQIDNPSLGPVTWGN